MLVQFDGIKLELGMRYHHFPVVMAWTIGKLTDARIRATKPGAKLLKLSDGRGLYLWVTPEGGRYWRFHYRYYGKQRLLALGIYPDITLARARQLADDARKNRANGVDPCEAKRQAKRAKKLADENSFSAVATRLIEKKRKEGRADVTLGKMKWILGKVEDALGRRPIREITTPEIIAVLRKEECLGNLETGRRMRTVLGEVFRYGIQNGLLEFDPVQPTRGAIARPSPKNHSAILEPERLGEMLRLIDEYAKRNVVTGSALQLMALLYARPGELRQAEWSEFDLEKGTWTIPARRMKMKQVHVKPLPVQALKILKHLHEVTGPVGHILPAAGRSGRPMSENTMNTALRRMGISGDEHVSHGFRATASTMLNDSNLFSSDAVEFELSHREANASRRAYRRGEAMAERRRMAQWWADHLDLLRDEVCALGKKETPLADGQPQQAVVQTT